MKAVKAIRVVHKCHRPYVDVIFFRMCHVGGGRGTAMPKRKGRRYRVTRRRAGVGMGRASEAGVGPGGGPGVVSATFLPSRTFPSAVGGLRAMATRVLASVGEGQRREYDVFEGRRALTGDARVGRVFRRDVKLSLAWLKRLNADWQHHTLVLKPVKLARRQKNFGGLTILSDAAASRGLLPGLVDRPLLIHFMPHSDDPESSADTEIRLLGGGSTLPTRGRVKIEEFRDDGTLQLTHCGRASFSLAELRNFADETSRTRYYSVGTYDCRHFKAEALQHLAVQPRYSGAVPAQAHAVEQTGRSQMGARGWWLRIPEGMSGLSTGPKTTPTTMVGAIREGGRNDADGR